MEKDELEPDEGPTRPMPAGSDTPTKPGERLRRILAASEEDTQPFHPVLNAPQPEANANEGEPPSEPNPTEVASEVEIPAESGGAIREEDVLEEQALSPEKLDASAPAEEQLLDENKDAGSEMADDIRQEPGETTLEPAPEAPIQAAPAEMEPGGTSTEPVQDAQIEAAPPTEPAQAEAAAIQDLVTNENLPDSTAMEPAPETQIEALLPSPVESAGASVIQPPAADASPQPPTNEEPSRMTEEPASFDRHPTGAPDQTGGWYGDSIWPAEPIPTKSEEPTQPMVVLPAVPPEATVPSPVQPQPQPYLPQRVNEVDVNATRVTPAAYGGGRQNRRHYSQTNAPVPPAPAPPTQKYPQVRPGRPASYPPRGKPKRKGIGCFWKGLIGILFIGVLGVVGVLSFLVYQYFTISAQLPSVDDLQAKASQFETTRIVDRNGNTIYEILNPNAGRRTYVTLDKISPYLIATTLATEDKDFYSHPGFDIVALFRALWQNYSAGETVSGASTITQQLAKMLLLSPTEASQQTVQRKAREIILAAELTRQYSKDEILEIYLNEINYGNRSYGIEAAAESYFNTTADKLDLGQAAFLTGIPQAPSVYDIFSNRAQTLQRFEQVIQLAYILSQERDCIYVSNNIQKVCIGAVEASKALDEIEKNTTFQMPASTIKDPHWVTYIRTLLESQFDPQTIYRSGFTVYTTLDQNIQDQAQQIVTNQVKGLADKKVTDGALVAIKPSTGEILAMVGSADFYNDQIAGQINMAISPRQPGSSIKPITYTAAFEKGWTPSTVLWDVPSEFPPSGDPNDTRPPYKPTDYSGLFSGPVTVRYALANSLNVPAVKTLQFVGVYGKSTTPGQEGLIGLAQRMGITTLTRPDYGLALTLGGGEVTVLDMTSAFSIFANGGSRNPPYAITKIVDHDGKTVYQYQPPAAQQVIRPEYAFLISSILSDNQARTPSFGANSVLNLPFSAAVKTGTTNDFKDNWTIGYTPDLAVGVWVGNADDSAMVNTTGVTGAAPIWSDFMKYAVPILTNNKPSPFPRPDGIVEKVVCAISGTEPSQWCPSQRGEYFASDQPPLPDGQDFWQQVTIDTWTGLRASNACSDFTKQKLALNVTDPWAIKWLTTTDQGKAWAKNYGFPDPIYFSPTQDCTQNDSRPTIVFSAFRDGDTITGAPLDIYAVVDATSGFKQFKLEYGIGDKPVTWKQLGDVFTQPAKQPSKIYTWDMANVPPGKFSLRITLQSDHNTSAVKTIVLNNQVPTATPTSTMTATPTFTPTMTSTLTPTRTSTPTPTVTPTPSDTPVPTTPVPSPTPTQTLPPPPPP